MAEDLSSEVRNFLDRFGSLARALYDDDVSNFRPFDEGEIVKVLDRWAYLAAQSSVTALFGDDDFLPFWLGLEKYPRLAQLFLLTIGEIRGSERLPRQSMTPREYHGNWVSPLYEGYVRLVKDPNGLYNGTALGTLCRLTLAGRFPIEKMRELVEDQRTKELLIFLANDQWSSDRDAAKEIIQQLAQ